MQADPETFAPMTTDYVYCLDGRRLDKAALERGEFCDKRIIRAEDNPVVRCGSHRSGERCHFCGKADLGWIISPEGEARGLHCPACGYRASGPCEIVSTTPVADDAEERDYCDHFSITAGDACPQDCTSDPGENTLERDPDDDTVVCCPYCGWKCLE